MALDRTSASLVSNWYWIVPRTPQEIKREKAIDMTRSFLYNTPDWADQEADE